MGNRHTGKIRNGGDHERGTAHGIGGVDFLRCAAPIDADLHVTRDGYKVNLLVLGINASQHHTVRTTVGFVAAIVRADDERVKRLVAPLNGGQHLRNLFPFLLRHRNLGIQGPREEHDSRSGKNHQQ